MRCNNLFYISFLSLLSGCSALGPTSPAPVQSPAAQSAPTATPSRPERSEALLQALLALGLDYRYGGNSPVTGFDCSGLVAHVYREAWGIRLPHNTLAQSEAGIPVSLAELQPGDLVFYDTLNRPYSHVGIYLGDGRFVHAPKSGARVRVESLQSAYWSQRFSGARRIEPPLRDQRVSSFR
jgi:cell wall-associated NlpC family hydrolase